MIRLLIVGETGVGKTSLLVRFNEGNFYSDQKTTIGVDYKAKEIDIDGEVVKLQVDPYIEETSHSMLTHMLISTYLLPDLGHCWSRTFQVNDISILRKGTRCCNRI